MQALTAGTVRACIHDLRFRDHFLDDQLLSTPHLYFLSLDVVTGLLAELDGWLEEKEYEYVAQMQGSLSHRNAADPAAFERASYRAVLDSFTPPPGVRY